MDEKQARQAAESLGIQTPQNAADLRRLLQQFGPALSAQNRSLIEQVLHSLESGDQAALEALARQLGAAKGR